VYFEELEKAMTWLANHEDTLFLGQAVSVPGTAMSTTLQAVAPEKLIELPVAEEMQMGISVGLAIDGFVPISIFPRWNFILLGMNQLINHLDRMPQISNNGYPTKVIIRTSIGSERPLHPQYQHVGDFSEAIAMMLNNTDVVTLEDPTEIFPAYQYAYERTDGRSTIIAEYGDFYSEK